MRKKSSFFFFFSFPSRSMSSLTGVEFIEIVNTKFIQNFGKYSSGGGLLVDTSASVWVSNSKFFENSVSLAEGISVDDLSFADGVLIPAFQGGGGLAVRCPLCFFTGRYNFSTFLDSSLFDVGLVPVRSIHLENTEFARNSIMNAFGSVSGGGGAFLLSFSCSMSNVSFVGNVGRYVSVVNIGVSNAKSSVLYSLSQVISGLKIKHS